jgi:hypothetical protein
MEQDKRHAAALDKLSDLLEEALSIVQGLEQDKQLAFDSKKWQASEKGKEAMEELSFLEQLASSIEKAQEFLGNVRAE